MIDLVSAYGVDNTGAVDASALVQDGVDDHGWVYLPGGTYRWDSMVRTPGRRRITLAPDATIVRSSSAPLFTNTPSGGGGGSYDGYGDITFEGGTLDCQGAIQRANSGAISVAHATGVTIRDMVIKDVPSWHAIECNSSKTVLIENVRFEGFVDTTSDNSRWMSEAIQIDAATSSAAYPWGGPFDNTVCSDVTVTLCWFGASGTAGTQPWPRGVGSHNTAEPARHRHCNVVTCTFENLTDSAIQTYFWDGGTITDNTIISPDGEGIVVKDDSRYVIVCDNRVYDSGRTGLWVNTACTQITLRDNDVIGSSRLAHDTHYGIRVSGSCSNILITGHRVRRRSSGNNAKYGLSLATGVSGVMYYGNDLRLSGVTGSLQDDSTSPITSAINAQ